MTYQLRALGLLSVPAALLLAFLTPVLATAFDDDVRSWLRDLDSVPTWPTTSGRRWAAR
jgi:hypothetical protein